MALSQARVIERLEQACSDLNTDEFILAFLDAYGFPKSTITQLRNSGDTRKVARRRDRSEKSFTSAVLHMCVS